MSVSKIEAKIKDLEQAVQAYNKNNIKLSANGGNSITFLIWKELVSLFLPLRVVCGQWPLHRKSWMM